MRVHELRIEHVVIGSGAAGFQAALRLHQFGETDLAVITEHINAGTSRNTGSDKQTYYKLSLAGRDFDSVRSMAEDLFAGGCVDGDQALCEASLSPRCFFSLVESGVPFPCTEYDEFMGYKTDHDRGRRAASAGPYTSRIMTECLEKQVKEKDIRILDQMQAVRLLVKDGILYGVLCLDKSSSKEASYVLVWCKNLILATGGPAGMYHDSVYPVSQLGAGGLAFEAGVKGKNLTEWQFGMASLNPRWNVSGTYMQVLPTFLSTDQEGNDEREFLTDYFEKPEEMLSLVFLKGYQWPFDVNKIYGGSSVIDLLVYQETILKGRRVFLDFTRNTKDQEIPFEKLLPEAYDYLKQAGALFGTPVERLRQMNETAIGFYRDHHVDLYRDKLEIAVCAQHNNGGIATDAFWETDILGLFAVGEACGSHGVTRPGGTALNAGQVGALRAAGRIHYRKLHGEQRGSCPEMGEAELRKEAELGMEAELRKEAARFMELPERASGTCTLSELWNRGTRRMSASGGMIRSKEGLNEALEAADREFGDFLKLAGKPDVRQLPMFYRLRDMLLSQKVYLSAMLDYAKSGAGSRGSALYTDSRGEKPDERFPDLYRCRPDHGAHDGIIQEIVCQDGVCSAGWRPVRPLPEADYFFENQWKLYRERNLLTGP
ncbi:FAD-binding protein [Clostridium sp. MCC353]|uniref:FAD-binding protein n=1 Tax=Clostridium sp. MCC353 TaxID=2592646 RepID=UPI001C0140F5|nr:FAD-binding protein [Clostridium sp. MCC353]MBT9775185.1 FAD-binding protein [Clostridium sp. MCC353]